VRQLSVHALPIRDFVLCNQALRTYFACVLI
jgi:hypothetical protein